MVPAHVPDVVPEMDELKFYFCATLLLIDVA